MCVLIVDDSFQYIQYIGLIALVLINIAFVLKILFILFNIFKSNFSGLYSKVLKSKGYENDQSKSREVIIGEDLKKLTYLKNMKSVKEEESENIEKEKTVSDEKKMKFIKEVFSEIESEGEKGDIN